jgi:hypothetical protein
MTVTWAGAIPPHATLMVEGRFEMKQKLERPIAMTFRVTAKEREMIRKAQARAGVKNMRTYLLNMAVNGRIIKIDLDGIQEMNRLLSNATNTINQMAKKVNETGSVHITEIGSIKAHQDEIWLQQKEILRRLGKALELL